MFPGETQSTENPDALSLNDAFTASLYGFKHEGLMKIDYHYVHFSTHKCSLQNTIIHINLQELLQTLGSDFADLLCITSWMLWLLSARERVLSCGIYYGLSRRTFLLSNLSRASKLQHQTSVSQPSLWFVYVNLMFSILCLCIHVFLQMQPTDKLGPLKRSPYKSVLALSR